MGCVHSHIALGEDEAVPAWGNAAGPEELWIRNVAGGVPRSRAVTRPSFRLPAVLEATEEAVSKLAGQ